MIMKLMTKANTDNTEDENDVTTTPESFRSTCQTHTESVVQDRLHSGKHIVVYILSQFPDCSLYFKDCSSCCSSSLIIYKEENEEKCFNVGI